MNTAFNIKITYNGCAQRFEAAAAVKTLRTVFGFKSVCKLLQESPDAEIVIQTDKPPEKSEMLLRGTYRNRELSIQAKDDGLRVVVCE